MKTRLRTLIVGFLAFLLIPLAGGSVISIQGQQGNEIFLPTRVEPEEFLFANTGNDIFFQSSIDNAVLPHEFKSTESSYNLYSYDGTDRSDMGGFNQIVDTFTATDPGSLYQASNLTNSALDLEYSAVYYDLSTGQSNPDASMVLFEKEMSGLRFEIPGGIPHIIDLKIKGQKDSLKMKMFLVTPSGEVYDYSVYSDEFQTFVNQFIPFVPKESGLYTLYLQPSDEDIILENLNVYEVPSGQIVSVSSGYEAKWDGTETQTLFFKLEANDTKDITVLDLTSKVFYNESVASPDVLLGSLDLKYFTPTTNIFGGDMPATEPVIQWKGNGTYIAVTATPPNDEDQFIRGVKNELGLNPGFDVEYVFWGQEFGIEEFTPDLDLVVEDPDQPNNNKYFWSTSEDLLIGVNSTLGAFVTLTNLDQQELVYYLDSSANNILNVASGDPTILPIGNYLVEIEDSTTSLNRVRLHTLDLLSFDLGDVSTYVLNLDEPLFFRLPITGPIKEYFNFTYLGFGVVNASIDVDITLFDSTFTDRLTTTQTFDEYYTGGTSRTSANNSVVGNTILSEQYNIQIGYLRIAMSGNRNYTAAGTLGGTNLPDLQANFRIERLNYLEVWQDGNPLNQYESRNLEQSLGDVEALNGTKNRIIYVYDFTSATTFTGYNIQFTSTNLTYSIYSFVDWSNLWHNGIAVNSATQIDGIDYYNYELEFGTNMETSFGFIVVFEFNPSLNGTFSIDLDTVLVQQTSGVTLGSIETSIYQPPFDTPTSDGTSPKESNEGLLEGDLVMIGGAVFLVVAVLAGGTFVIKRRKSQ